MERNQLVIAEENRLLRERNALLEEANQQITCILDVLASSRDFQEGLSGERQRSAILRAAFQQMKRVLAFSSMAFYISTEDNSFDLAECLPADSAETIEQEVDLKIVDGSFAWALSQNHPLILPDSRGELSVVLQAMSTRSRVCGMFVGFMPGVDCLIDAPSQNALTIILLNTAYALESARLNLMIRDHAQNLEHKVAERTVELHNARNAAEEANRSKSTFLANMSHELRTPLNAVIGFSDVLLSQSFGPLNERQQEYLGYVFQSSRHLLELINDILDLSKIEANKMELRLSDTDIEHVLASSSIMLKEIAHSRKVRIGIDIDHSARITIRADERMLKQVMFNLLSNAVKFTPEGGQVSVTARGSVQSSELPQKALQLLAEKQEISDCYLLISVTDTGIGLHEDDLERIFKPFEQSDGSITREYEGTGLGLTLCREFLALHSGTVWAESAGRGKGSTFRVILPQTAAPVQGGHP